MKSLFEQNKERTKSIKEILKIASYKVVDGFAFPMTGSSRFVPRRLAVVKGAKLKGICHPSAHAQQFDFLPEGTFFKVDICVRNPFPSTL